MKEFYDKNRVQINQIVFVLVFVIGMYVFFNHIFSYVAPFVVAYLLSVILSPLSDFLIKKLKAPRWFAGMTCIILVIFLVMFVGTSITTRIFKEAQGLIESIPELVNEIEKVANDFGEKFSEIFSRIPTDLQATFSNITNSLLTSVTSSLGKIFKDGSLGFVSKVPNIIMFVFFCLISCYFFISDKDNIRAKVIEMSPYWVTKNFKIVRKGILDALMGYLKAQLILMSIVATICIISLSFMKYPYALLVGLLIALVDALPVFGSGFILWPWIAFSFLTNEYKQAVWLIVTYGIIFITRQVLEPRVLGKQMGMHPIVTLMSIFIGLKVFGFLGFILGPLTFIVLKSFIKPNPEVLKTSQATNAN